MYRGTTPTLIFNFNEEADLSDVSTCWVTISNLLRTKVRDYSLDDVEINNEDKTISLALTQEDTLYFGQGTIQIQVRLKNSDEMAYASNIVQTTMQEILKEGEI